MLVIKFKLNEEYRRFRVEEKLDFESLCSKLLQILARPEEKLIDLYFLQYEDDEGDVVYITSTVELEEAIRLAKEKNNSVLRLTLIPVTNKTHVSRPLSPDHKLIGQSSQAVATVYQPPTNDSAIPPVETPHDNSPEVSVNNDQIQSNIHLVNSIALACTVADVTRKTLVDKCNSLSSNTVEQCNLMSGQVQRSTADFSVKIVDLCAKTADDCISNMQPLCQSTIASVDREIQTLTALLKSVNLANDMKPQCLATTKLMEEEISRFHQNFLPTIQECKNLQSTCDDLRTEISKQCSDLTAATSYQCLSLSDSIVASIMAI